MKGSGGSLSYGFPASLHNPASPIVTIGASRYGFTAVHQDGSVTSWGDHQDASTQQGPGITHETYRVYEPSAFMPATVTTPAPGALVLGVSGDAVNFAALVMLPPCTAGSKANAARGADHLPAAFDLNYASIACEPCRPGTAQSEPNRETCDACEPGYFQANAGQAACDPCPAGGYEELSGQTSCTPCPVGNYQARLGQKKSWSCNLCPVKPTCTPQRPCAPKLTLLQCSRAHLAHS